MLSNLKKEIQIASKEKYAVAGFNIFGIEDARPVIKTAELLNVPTLLMINKLASDYMPIEYWVSMLLPLARDAKVPVSIHLDHTRDVDTAIKAIEAGFTSVMYDGSQLPIEENIRNTNIVAREARKRNVTLEGEIGSVPYADIPGHAMDLSTSREMLLEYATKTDVDWIAVSVGQIHRLQNATSNIDFKAFENLKAVTEKPLVIHGGTGIKEEDLRALCMANVGKVNFGTSLRIAFGTELRKQVIENKDEFDRLKLFVKPSMAVGHAAEESINKVLPIK
jgi:fructose-bisphosphate aldolase class II